MSRRTIECLTCGEQHASVFAAAMCCDPVQDAETQDRPFGMSN